MRCDDCQPRLLDLAYGLLDPAEATAMDAHVVDCPACTTAVAAALGEKALLARAAKVPFPHVQFLPPASGIIEPRRSTPRTLLVRWAVAAGVLLAVAGTVGPTVHSAIRSAASRNGMQDALASVRQTRQAWATEKTAFDERTILVRNALESATKTHDAVVSEWVNAESDALNAKAFSVEVTGPASAVAGAPNDYRIRVAAASGSPVTAAVRVAVIDSDGKVRVVEEVEPVAAKAGITFRLPASVWNDLSAGTGMSLTLTTTDPETGRTSRIAEPINLLPPVYTTFLATDRSLYQPGETIFFRSVTLDRARFLPPDHDLSLRYALLDAKGNTVPGQILTGAAIPVDPGKSFTESILGPDAKPVRGVGCGAFTLPAAQADGDYTLLVHELPAGWTKPELPAGSVPFARRKVQIRKFVPSQLATDLVFDAASYGPGDTVTATLKATELGRPIGNVLILPSVSADGKKVPFHAPATIDGAGRATVRFVLPNDALLTRAEVKVVILHGQGEEVIRPVPLALKTVGIEFFPEGGDLLAGVENRVYFRARTPDGKPVEFRGELFDGEKVIAAVTSITDKDQTGANRGLGLFEFKPQEGKRYILRGLAGEFPLPAAKSDGVSLAVPAGVTGSSQPISVRLAAGTTGKVVVVGAYSRGRPVATARAVLEPGNVTAVELRPEPGSPGGVTRVTVFEESGDGSGRKSLTPRAERLMFRRPAETLVLSYSTSNTGPATPGSPVALTVTAKTETGQPTGAILWAAVVSETVFGRADDRTARGLPAHFYLCGEIEKPDDLEFADFLLTDHPRATESLDLVLGTQGWRRFAEQSPEVFRKSAPPGGADRLLVAVESRGPVPAEVRPLVQSVAERFQPRYQKALESVEAAERTVKIDGTAAESAKQSYSNALTALAQATEADRSGTGWTAFRIPAAVLLFVLAVVLAAVRTRLFRRDDVERRYLAVAVLVSLVLAWFLLTAVALSSPATVSDATAELKLAGSLGVTVYPSGQNAPAFRAVAVAPRASSDGQNVMTRENPGIGPGIVRPSVPAKTIPVGHGSPLESAAGGKPTVRMMLATNPLATAEKAFDYAAGIEKRLAAVIPPGPAGNKVRDAVPKLPPLIVREYAHAGPDPGYATRGVFDATDTILWRPVLIVPGTGTIILGFNLSGGTTGYRVLIAGHTLDGRVGTVTGTLPVVLPK